jgi:hypothetical protein
MFESINNEPLLVVEALMEVEVSKKKQNSPLAGFEEQSFDLGYVATEE